MTICLVALGYPMNVVFLVETISEICHQTWKVSPFITSTRINENTVTEHSTKTITMKICL